MKRILAAACAALFLFLLSSCALIAGDRYTSPHGVAWEDFAPFAAGLRGRALLAREPSLRDAPVYHLELSINDDLTRVTGSETVRFTHSGSEPLAGLDFVLLPNLVAGSLRVERVRVDGARLPVALSADGMVLHVRFPRALTAATRSVISIGYDLTVPQSTAVGFGGLESHDGILSLAYAYPMIPASLVWDYGRPPSYGDLTANPVSFYLVEISYPRGLVLAAPGVLLSHRRTQTRTIDLLALGPARDFYLEVGRALTLTRREDAGIELRAFAPAAGAEAAASALDTAGRALAIYERLFGPYPYRSLTFVSSRFDALGLEFPGIIVLTAPLLGASSEKLDGVRVAAVREATVAHEVAHQWFYALVGNDQLSEPWIDESFAQYATLRYYRARYGEAGAAVFERALQTRWSRIGDEAIPIGGAVSSYTPKQYSAIIYGRAPIFLETLSKRMGSTVFDRFVRRLVREYAWKTITGNELRAAAERSCACSLESLWRQWVTPRPAVASHH